MNSQLREADDAAALGSGIIITPLPNTAPELDSEDESVFEDPGDLDGDEHLDVRIELLDIEADFIWQLPIITMAQHSRPYCGLSLRHMRAEANSPVRDVRSDCLDAMRARIALSPQNIVFLAFRTVDDFANQVYEFYHENCIGWDKPVSIRDPDFNPGRWAFDDTTWLWNPIDGRFGRRRMLHDDEADHSGDDADPEDTPSESDASEQDVEQTVFESDVVFEQKYEVERPDHILSVEEAVAQERDDSDSFFSDFEYHGDERCQPGENEAATTNPIAPGEIPATWHACVDLCGPWRLAGVGRGAYITYHYDDPRHTSTVYTGHGPCDLFHDFVENTPIPEHALRILRMMARPRRVSIHVAPEDDDGRFPPGGDHGEWWPRVGMVDIDDICLGLFNDAEGPDKVAVNGICGKKNGHALFASPREHCICNSLLLNSTAFEALLTHPNLTAAVLDRFASLKNAPMRFEAHRKAALVRFTTYLPTMINAFPATISKFLHLTDTDLDVQTRYISVIFGTILEEVTLTVLGIASPWLAAAGALALGSYEAYQTEHTVDKWFKLCTHVGLSAVRRLSGWASWMVHATWNVLVFICSQLHDPAASELLLSGRRLKSPPPAPRTARKGKPQSKNKPMADADGRPTVPPLSRKERSITKQLLRAQMEAEAIDNTGDDAVSEISLDDELVEEPLPETAWVYFPTSPGLGNGPMTIHLSNGDSIRHRVVETEVYPAVDGADKEWAELCVLTDAIVCDNCQVVVNPTLCARSLIQWLNENCELKVECYASSGLRLAPPSNRAYKELEPLPPLPQNLLTAYHFDGAFTGGAMTLSKGMFRAFELSSSSIASGMGPLTLEVKAEHYRVTSHPACGFYSVDEVDFSRCLKVRHTPLYVRNPLLPANTCLYVTVNTFECRDYVTATPYALHYLEGADFPVKIGPAYRNADGTTYYPYRLLRDVAQPYGLIDLRVLAEAAKSPQIKSGSENAWTVAAHKAAAAMTTQPGASRDALVATAVAILSFAETRKDMRSSVTAAVLNGAIKFDRIGSGWRELFAGRADVLPRAEAFMAMHPGVANLLNWVVSHSLSPYGGWMLALLQAIVGFLPALYPRSTFRAVMGDYLEPSNLHFAGHINSSYIERAAQNFVPTKQPDFNLRAAPIDPAHEFIMKRCDDLAMSVKKTPLRITHTRDIDFQIHTLELKGDPRPTFLAGPLCVHAAATYSSLCTVAALCLRQGLVRPPVDLTALRQIERIGLAYIGEFFSPSHGADSIDDDKYGTWLACQKPAVRQEHDRITKLGEWESPLLCDVTGTAFTKTELHKPAEPGDEPGLPRVIVDSRPGFNRYTAPDVYATYHHPTFGTAFCGKLHGKAFRHLYSPGCKGETLTQHFLEQCCDEGEGGSPCLVVLGDVTKWDAHIRPEHILVMIAWYTRMGFSSEALACFTRKMKSSAVVTQDKNGTGSFDFKATLDGTVKSGVPDTTFGNTLFNIFLMFYSVGVVINGNTDVSKWVYHPAVTASGDDSVVIVHRDGKALRGYIVSEAPADAASFNAAITNVCYTLGFKVKVHSNLHGINGISYCGGRFYPVPRKTIRYSPPFAAQCDLEQVETDTYYAFGNSVKRQLFKCGFICQPHWDHATSVWAGTMVQQCPLYNHIPFLGTLWRAQLPIAKASRQTRSALEDHKVYNTYQYEPLSIERSFRYDFMVDDDGESFSFGDYTLSQAHNLMEQRYSKLAEALQADRTLVLADPLIASALRGQL